MLKILFLLFGRLREFCQFKKKSEFCTRFSKQKTRINNVDKQKKVYLSCQRFVKLPAKK